MEVIGKSSVFGALVILVDEKGEAQVLYHVPTYLSQREVALSNATIDAAALTVLANKNRNMAQAIRDSLHVIGINGREAGNES